MAYSSWSYSQWYIYWDAEKSSSTIEDEMLAIWLLGDQTNPSYSYIQLKENRDEVLADIASHLGSEPITDREDFDEAIDEFLQDVEQEYRAKNSKIVASTQYDGNEHKLKAWFKTLPVELEFYPESYIDDDWKHERKFCLFHKQSVNGDRNSGVILVGDIIQIRANGVVEIRNYFHFPYEELEEH